LDRVAIAWREDPHTAKAVLPALRYIATSDHVFLLAGLRKGTPTPGIPEVLAERHVSAEMHLTSVGTGAFGEALLAKVHELRADLLVMGAYANSSLHNLVYGGVTQFMLNHADFPILMRY
jgi:nucleotide-binding universal stress UspA family protein